MKGTFVLSLDTELAWGVSDRKALERYDRHFEHARRNIDGLLDLLERHDISATWAFLGHLFLKSCERVEPGADPHPDVLAHRRDWHDRDPGTDRSTDPFWYGDDVLEKVLSATPRQEIGCHTFSHPPFGEPGMNEEIARSQLTKCIELAEARGLSLDSLVFPRNVVGYLSAAKACGLKSYRGPELSWFRRLPGPTAKVGHLLHRFMALPAPVYDKLETRHGLLNIPASMFLMPPDGIRRLIPGRSRVAQAVRGLRRAAGLGGLFHLWFHPWNIGPSGRMLKWLDEILREAARLRSDGALEVRTMSALTRMTLSDPPRNDSGSSA